MKKRINWTQVYSYFLSSETISLKDTAEKFHISYDVLRQKASSEHWTQKKKGTRQNAIQLLEQQTSIKIAEIKRDEIFIARALLARAAKSLANGVLPTNARDIQKWISIGVEIERRALEMDKRAQTISNKQKTRNKGYFRK